MLQREAARYTADICPHAPRLPYLQGRMEGWRATSPHRHPHPRAAYPRRATGNGDFIGSFFKVQGSCSTPEEPQAVQCTASSVTVVSPDQQPWNPSKCCDHE